MAILRLVDGAETEDFGDIPEDLIAACLHQMKAPAQAPPKLKGTALAEFRAADYAEKRREVLLWLAKYPELWKDGAESYRKPGTVFEEYERDRTGWSPAMVARKGFDTMLAAPTRADFKPRWPVVPA